jgi:hypothetical protein
MGIFCGLMGHPEELLAKTSLLRQFNQAQFAHRQSCLPKTAHQGLVRSNARGAKRAYPAP